MVSNHLFRLGAIYMKCELIQWIEGDGEMLAVALDNNRVYIISSKHLEQTHKVEDARACIPLRTVIEFKEWIFTILVKEYLRAAYYLE